MKWKARLGRDGRWRVHARAFLVQNPLTGKQSIRTKTVYGETEKEASTKADQFVADERSDFQRTGTLPERRCKDSLAVYGRKWLASRKPAGKDDDLKRSTWDGYSELFRTYIEEPIDEKMPLMGRVPMEGLRAEHVRELYKYLWSTENKNGQKSKGRARALHRVLRQMFKTWYKDDPENRINLREALHGVFGQRKSKPRPEAYTGDQLAAFLKAADSDHYRVFWYLFAFTGMRPGELLALTREDVDLETLKVTVSKRIRVVPKQCRTAEEEKWEIDDPKTENSIREVLLPPSLGPIIQQHIDGHSKKSGTKPRRRFAGRYGDLVFRSRYGNPLEWSSLRASYYRICERAKLGTLEIRPEKAPRFKPLLKPYALRHTHATLELEDGVPLEVVSARLGHRDTYFTANTYIVTRTERQKGAAEAAEKRFTKFRTGT